MPNIPANPFWFESSPADPNAQRLGLTEEFISTLPGGLVGIELQPIGTRLATGETFGFAHAAERTVDLRAPQPLEILIHNTAALADPRLILASPALRGWLIEFIPR